MEIRALIADDEPLARQRIRDLLVEEPDIELVGECHDGEETLAAVARSSPELLFLDVQMPGMDGFEVLARMAHGRIPAVIFVTAHDRYALKAFDVHALDYLLKPFDRERFREALNRARNEIHREDSERVDKRIRVLLGEREEERSVLERFVVKESERIFFVNAEAVDCIEATGNYVTLYSGKETHTIRQTMARLESRLDRKRFVRIHRSWIVNVGRIREFQPWFNGEYVVVTEGGKCVRTSRSFRENVESLFEECH
jgi:two-component system, LytTR family, response regulator